MSPVISEGRYRGEFLYSEACGTRSLETVTIDTGDLAAGTVLGQITKGAATGAAVAGGTGNGTITAAPAVAAGAKAGVYRAVCIEPATNVGKFLVTDPDGINLGVATVAVEFVGGGLTFTIADGSTDFASGDSFTITVAAGSLKYVAFNQDGVDGSEIAAAILYDNVDATSADVEAVIVARDAEVNGSEITWPADIEAGEKTAAIAQLAVLGIIVR
ncbi:MAG: head decoration protein [Geobacter sp.]|nr:MAG: head decoration protein [Geobacter sp.]